MNVKSAVCIIGSALLLLYGAVLVALYHYQELIIFPGTKLPQDHTFAFEIPFKEITIPADGAHLNALHFPQPDPRGLIFFLHGNAGNLETWTTGLDFYQRVNYDLFIFDYRGYGKSTGRITSQSQLMADVRRAWDFIVPQYDQKPIVIYGRSLGTALAVELARQVHPEMLALVSPFSSAAAVAAERYPGVPSRLLRYPLNTEEIIGDVTSRTVILHGSADTFIPLEHSRRLASLMKAPVKLLVITEANHGDIHSFREYLNGLALHLP